MYRKFNQLVFCRELLSPYREKKSRGSDPAIRQVICPAAAGPFQPRLKRRGGCTAQLFCRQLRNVLVFIFFDKYADNFHKRSERVRFVFADFSTSRSSKETNLSYSASACGTNTVSVSEGHAFTVLPTSRFCINRRIPLRHSPRKGDYICGSLSRHNRQTGQDN